MHTNNLTSQYVLDTISRHCPEALSAYLQCVNRCNKEREVYFSKNMVEVDMSEQFRPFRNNIKKLARENFLSWAPLNDGISVILADIHDDE